MVVIHPKVMCYWLSIDPQANLVRQNPRVLDANRYKALQDKIDHLLKIGFIRVSNYPDWLANLVLVIKPNGKWRMSRDFLNHNKACSKESLSLPQIDQLVDTTKGYELLSFMDAYSRYNQILMYVLDESTILHH